MTQFTATPLFTLYVIRTLFIASDIALFVYTMLSLKTKKPPARQLFHIIHAAFLATSVYTILLFCNNEPLAVLLHGLYYIGFGIIMLFLLNFVIHTAEFTENKPLRIIHRIFTVLMCFDAISLIVNTFTHHLFTVVKEDILGTTIMTQVERYPMLDAHYYLCYLIIATVLILLTYRVFKSTTLYHIRYIWLIVGLFSLLIVNHILDLYFSLSYNLFILLFAVYGAVLYHSLMQTLPRRFLNNILDEFARNTSESIIVLDHKDRCVLANRATIDMFSLSMTEPPLVYDYIKRLFREEGMDIYSDGSFDMNASEGGFTLNLHVDIVSFHDKKGRNIGRVVNLHDQTQQIRQLQRQRYEATHDMMTGLYNASYFYSKVRDKLDNEDCSDYVIACIDIDNFKFINDIYGPEAGDKILISIAENIREQNIPGTIYSRIESDSFAFFMKSSFVSRMPYHADFLKIIDPDSEDYFPINLHIGVYEITDKSVPVQVMCDHAFLAIKEIKGNAQKIMAYYKPEIRDDIIRNQTLIHQLRSSIENENFVLHLQPQYNSNGELHGAEVLIRWMHPTEGMIPPNSFIPLFEKSGGIVHLDKYVWEHTAALLKKWKKMDIRIPLSVNISPIDFYYVDICGFFTDLVKRYDLDPKMLHLEITESAVLETYGQNENFLEKLHAAGFIVEMDDFGSGYSSLNTLKDLDVDILKLDMKFLSNPEQPIRTKKILNTVVTLSKSLDIPALAEGVETEEELRLLQSLDCDIYQGYYFAKPMSVDTFEKEYMNGTVKTQNITNAR